MSHHKMRFFISIMIGLFLFTSISGCKHPQVDGTNVPSTIAASHSAAIPTGTRVTATPKATELPHIDLKGRVVRVYSQFGDQMLAGGGEKGSALDVMSTKTSKDMKLRERIQKVQKDYNCKIQFAGTQDHIFWQKVVDSCLSGSPVADFGFIGPEYIYKSVSLNGAFLTLDQFKDILQPDDPQLWGVAINKKVFTFSGMSLGMVKRYEGLEGVDVGFVTFFNKSMLIREGLWDKYNLYKMQKNKTWNWKAFDELSQKVSKDTNGDGELDQVGTVYTEYLLRALMHTNVTTNGDGGWVKVLSNGSAKMAINDTQHKPALDFLINLYKKGCLSADATGSTDVAINMFKSGDSAFLVEYGNRINVIKSAKMADTWGAVAMPLSPTGRKDYILPTDGYFPYVISRGVKNPTEVAYIMRLLVPPEQTSAEEEEVEAETYMSNFVGSETGTIDTYKMLAEPERLSTDMDGVFTGGVGVPMWIFFFNVKFAVSGVVTAEQLFQMQLPKMQGAINDYWGSVRKGAANMKKALTKSAT